MESNAAGIQWVIKSGAWIPVLLMVPNVLWMFFPPVDAGKQAAEPVILTVVEKAGLFAMLVLPFFYSLDLKKPYSLPVLICMGLALAVYYFCWARYFTGGRSAALLGEPLLGIPLPMAVLPVLFLLLLSSYLMGSWWMFGAAIPYGIAHIWISKISL